MPGPSTARNNYLASRGQSPRAAGAQTVSKGSLDAAYAAFHPSAATSIAGPQFNAAPAPAPWNPASIFSDPSYLAYRASLGLESDTAVARLRGAQDTARRNAALGIADVQAQGEIGRENIAGGMEARGLSLSGEREKAIARQRAAQGRQEAGIASNAGGSLGDLEFQIAQQRASQGRQSAQSAYDASTRAQANAQGIY